MNGITDMAILTVPTVAVLSMATKVHNGVGYFALHLLGGMYVFIPSLQDM